MSRIAVAVSGGADSLFALVSLQEQGHEVQAIHGRFLPSSPDADPVPALQDLCLVRHIPLHVLDFRQEFDAKVVQPFIEDYAAGRTPNPCTLCNANIKFGALMRAAEDRGAELLATGHYATLRSSPYASHGTGITLAQGADKQKDQSYFLALVPAQRLAKAVFPLANTHKQQNIALLEQQNIAVPLPRESQEICFVPADAYRPFVQAEAAKRSMALSGAGPMLVQEHGVFTKVGTHKGLWQYTEGQRRGLGVAWKEPLYVCGKDRERNALLLGNKESLSLRGCAVGQVNMLVPYELWPEKVMARVRYRQQEAHAQVVLRSGSAGNILHITFAELQSPTAPGQTAVVYDMQGCVLAGGVITSTF